MKFELDRAIEVLERTPAILRSMLTGLSEPWIHNNYGEKTFSPFDVVGHLIHGERTDWIPRTKIILEHGEARTFEPFDRYVQFTQSQGKTIGELLDTFEQLRRENIEELRALRLTPLKLALTGMHPEIGSVTLEQLLATWTVHDLNHIHQIAKCMAWQYKDGMGPFRPCVGVLKQN